MIMTITIAISEAELTTYEEEIWVCWLRITNDTPEVVSWMLPATAPATLIENELQAHFDRQTDYLWRLAEEKQYPVRSGETGAIEAKGGARQWYTANPGALQLFTLDGEDLETAITNLVATSFPLLTAGQRKQWEFLLTSLAYNDRVLVRREKLAK